MSNTPPLLLGCVADDFTGAGDVASFIARGNMRCLLINGVPQEPFAMDGEYGAIVIALKTRTAPVTQAVQETLQAFDWLRAHGAKTLYFKYCSTFDSTPKGNIGPVLDRVLEAYKIPYTILCPALPINQRTVKYGQLFVNGVPLDQSPMRNHPLNPMWDSDIVKLMESQSRFPCYNLTYDMLEQPDEAIHEQLERWGKNNEHFYVVVDYFEEWHGKRIAELFADLPVLSGGSALAGYLYANASETQQEIETGKLLGKGLILAGSCSEMTRRQIDYFLKHGGIAQRIWPQKLLDGSQTIDTLWQFVLEHQHADVLLYSSQSPDEIRAFSAVEQQRVSQLLEEVMAELGRRAVAQGIRHMIVAGGETSGAVMQSLGGNAYEIGPCVAPGVPILLPLGMEDMQLVLKSGNFGQEDFFTRTLDVMEKEGM